MNYSLYLSSFSVNSVSKVILVCGSSEYQSAEQVAVSSVELVAELVEIVLQELWLDAVIYVKQLPFGVANHNVNPREHFADVFWLDNLRSVFFD